VALFSPGGSRVLTASGSTALIWDAATDEEIASFRGHSELIVSASFKPDGAAVVTVSKNKTARLWDVATGKPIAVFRGVCDARRPSQGRH